MLCSKFHGPVCGVRDTVVLYSLAPLICTSMKSINCVAGGASSFTPKAENTYTHITLSPLLFRFHICWAF